MNKKHQEFFVKLSELMDEYECGFEIDSYGAFQFVFHDKIYNSDDTEDFCIDNLAKGIDQNE